MSLGERLKSARTQKGLTQKQLAQIINVKHNSISNWEHDQNQPDIETIRKICSALDVSIGYLFEDSPPNEGENSPLSQILNGVEFALFDAVRQLTEAEKMDILDYVLFKTKNSPKEKED